MLQVSAQEAPAQRAPHGAHLIELELMQSHMAQKPVLRGEVGCACVAREVSVERGGMGEAAIGRCTNKNHGNTDI